MSGIGVNLRVTGHCSQGGRKYMEDMFSVAYQQTVDLKDLEYAFFGIFDGHGGPQAATFAKEHLLDSIVSQKNFWSNDDEDVLRAIRDGYIATHYSMWKDLEKWPKTTTGLPSTSGSTATVAFIMKGKIYIGHVGDTAIVLGYQEDGVREWKAQVLTKDHKPESKEEKQRIEQSGGKVVNKSGVPRVVWNRPRLGHQGPVRRSTLIDEIPFLAVARSLGDFWSYNSGLDQFVVSPEPDVLVYPVDVLRFRCLVLGTDGLWNMMTPDRAVAIVQSTEIHNEKQVIYGLNNQYNKEWVNPSKTLVDRALERWVTTKLRADNTSVVTLLLDPPGPPRAQVLLKQINKWREIRGEGSVVAEEETRISVPKSGGLAIFTHYPSSEDVDQTSKQGPSLDTPTKEEREKRIMELINQPLSKSLEQSLINAEKEATGSAAPLKRCSLPVSGSTTARPRSEGKSCVEEASSDAENERIFPDCEPKKRRLSLDKKCTKPGVRRRPSLPALNGKANSLYKSRSLEESTRMLRSAAPMKTLRSRNIDLSDLSASVAAKRGRAPSPLTGKKQRLDEQRSTPSPTLNKRKQQSKDVEPTKSSFLKSYLESEDDAELFYDSRERIMSGVSVSSGGKRDLQEVSHTKKPLRERKHKSVSPPIMSKWEESTVGHREDYRSRSPALDKWQDSTVAPGEDYKSHSVSDSELSPMISTFVSSHNRRLRFQEDCSASNILSKRKAKTSSSTLSKGPTPSRPF